MFIRPVVAASSGYSAALALHLDGSDLSTLFQDTGGLTPVTADGQEIKYWADLSGNGNDVVAPAGKQCYYKTAGINSLGTVEGRSSNDGYFIKPAAVLTQTDNVTIFVVAQASSATGCFWSCADEGSGENNLKLFFYNNITPTLRRGMEINDSSGTSSSLYLTNPALGTPHQITGLAYKPNLRTRLNGVAGDVKVSAGDFITANNYTHVMNHHTFQSSFKGYVGEIKVYDGLLSDAEILAEEAILKAKWATP